MNVVASIGLCGAVHQASLLSPALASCLCFPQLRTQEHPQLKFCLPLQTPLMDPLSAPLVVVSLAAAVKDLVELGQKIHESFAKVLSNYQKAQSVAEEIKEMVDEIEVFYEDYKDTLDNTKDFRLALLGLLAKFRNFEASILPLFPQWTGGRTRDRLTRAWDTWRSNKKVEERISALHSDIVKLMRRFMMKSTMRIKVKQGTNHHETIRGLTGIAQGLEVVRRDVFALRTTEGTTMINDSYQSSGTTSDEFDCAVTMLAESMISTSVPMLRTHKVITDEVMTTAFIKHHINNIAKIVEEMSRLPASATASNSIASFWQIVPISRLAAMNITHLRNHVVRQVTHTWDLLNTKSKHPISIEDSAGALNILSSDLHTLGMGLESVLVGTWVITLIRLIYNANTGSGQPDCDADLATSLLNQSIRAYESGNTTHGLQEIKEAYTITHNLQNQNGKAVNFNFGILYSNILLQYARLVDNNRSIAMAIEAVQILENIFNVQEYTKFKFNLLEDIESVVEHCSSFIYALFSSARSTTALESYALALERLGIYLFRDGHPLRANHLGLLAISVRRHLVSFHGHEHNVDLASAIRSLVECGCLSCIPAAELIDMADEAINIYRELVEKDPPSYARQLVTVLWWKANTLESLQRDAESVVMWEEITILTGQIIQDSALYARALGNLSEQFRCLKRHDDAVRTAKLAITTYQEGTEIRAARYFNMSMDLWELQRYRESTEAARSSVALYRCLAMRDPKTWMLSLAVALSKVAGSLAASGDYDEALIVWNESVGIMLDNVSNTPTDASAGSITLCIAVAQTRPIISYALEHQDECVKVYSTTVRNLRRLSEIYTEEYDVFWALFQNNLRYAYSVLRTGNLQDAQQYIDRLLDTWNSKSEAIPECTLAALHAVVMTLKADILEAQGSIKQALLTNQEIPDIMRPFITIPCQTCFYEMIRSMLQEARLRVDLGNSEEGLKVAERALKLSRDWPELMAGILLLSLHVVAFTAVSCQNYNRAVEAAREGCDIATGSDWAAEEKDERDAFIHASLFAILASAEANLSRHDTALEYIRRAIDLSRDTGNIKTSISATVAERSHIEIRGTFAGILLETRNLAQTRQIFEEQRAYFSARVETRMGEYRDLAPILRMLGVIYCSEGRHEEGEAAAQELSRILKTLGSAFPSLQEQVKIRLRHQAKIPILKALDAMSEKLDCDHQTEVTSLFEI